MFESAIMTVLIFHFVWFVVELFSCYRCRRWYWLKSGVMLTKWTVSAFDLQWKRFFIGILMKFSCFFCCYFVSFEVPINSAHHHFVCEQKCNIVVVVKISSMKMFHLNFPLLRQERIKLALLFWSKVKCNTVIRESINTVFRSEN